MEHKPLSDIEVVKFLLFQQFYYGITDVIYGRTQEISVKIDGSGAVIENFYEFLVKDISLIRNGMYKEYLQKFNDRFIKLDVEDILTQFNKNYYNIDESQRSSQIITSILFSELLMSIRKSCFDELVNEIKIKLIVKLTDSNKKIKPKDRIDISEDFIQEKMKKLSKLYSLSDKNIGIIYNLSFLKTLAFKMNNKKVIKQTKKNLEKLTDIIIRKIY